MKASLVRYEWDPTTETATFVHDHPRTGEVRTQRLAPLKVNPGDYWVNLRRLLELTVVRGPLRCQTYPGVA